MENFKLKCLFCNNEDQDEFQTTLEDWNGWSEYTVEDYGYVEFKCKKCGTFGTTKNEIEGSNKLNMFEVECKNCGCKEWTFKDTLIEETESPCIVCNKCGIMEQ